jgi:thiamine pyrophosphate-dependent acetolactate synthase large subunit-like protein/nitrite reductase/ring-hydroxylating ferredoxin subunit
MAIETNWYKILSSPEVIEEGKTQKVQAGKKLLAISKVKGIIGAIDNVCSHMGGPLGEGVIDNGYIKCPWHGYEFHPCTGKSPEGFNDEVQAYQVDIRDDGVYVAIKEESVHEPTISDVMVETMINWGVDTVFGMVGHSNLGLADAMRLQEKKGNLKFIGIRHEGAASFAASAYGKLIGKPAACLTIAGPGATNLFTGMWDAKVDRAPLLVLTGQIATQVVGTGTFQEVDLVSAFNSVAEFNHRVQADSPHGELMSLAIKSAILNRDVSHLTFPDEVQVAPAGDAESGRREGRMPNLSVSPPHEEIDKSVNLINKAHRPVIIIGHGATNATTEILSLAEKLGAPVLTTFKAKGIISDRHSLACGVLGKSGTPVAAHFMSTADLLLVFGASFSKHTGIAESIPTIQVDYDPLVLAKFHAILVRVLGEIGITASLFNTRMKNHTPINNPRSEIAKKWADWREEKTKRANEFSDKITPAKVFLELNKFAPEEGVMCVDVGNNAYSFGRYFESIKHRFLMSGYLGSIGYALPASIGAWSATNGEMPVIAVAGDGGFAQYLAELTTLVKYNIPVKLVIINNNQLAKISKEQREGQFEVWKTNLSNPKYSEFAESCGMIGLRAENNTEIAEKMKQLFEVDGPALLDVITDPDKM